MHDDVDVDAMPDQYLVCEVDEEGSIIYVLDGCTTHVEALERGSAHHAAPKGSLHYVPGPIAIYHRVSLIPRPSDGAEGKQ
jgi:hypothetical protein